MSNHDNDPAEEPNNTDVDILDLEDDVEEESEDDQDESSDEGEGDIEPPKKQHTVSLKKYIHTEKELKVAKARIKELESRGGDLDIRELADELNMEEGVVEKLVKVVTTRIKPDIEATQIAQRQAQIKANFDREFDKLVEAHPELKSKKDILWDNSTKVSRFRTKTLEEIALDLFGLTSNGKSSSEDDVDGSDGADSEEHIDFDKMTPEQHEKVLNDPKLRARYYAHKDDPHS